MCPQGGQHHGLIDTGAILGWHPSWIAMGAFVDRLHCRNQEPRYAFVLAYHVDRIDRVKWPRAREMLQGCLGVRFLGDNSTPRATPLRSEKSLLSHKVAPSSMQHWGAHTTHKVAWLHIPKCASTFGTTLVHYANSSLPAAAHIPSMAELAQMLPPKSTNPEKQLLVSYPPSLWFKGLLWLKGDGNWGNHIALSDKVIKNVRRWTRTHRVVTSTPLHDFAFHCCSMRGIYSPCSGIRPPACCPRGPKQ